MSDFTIPGVKSNIDTAKMIKALVDVERVPLERMQKDVENYNRIKKAWQDLNVKLSKLKDSAATLYGFQNPFNERIAQSSDEAVLTASASREAVEEEKKILVKKTATVDKFVSKSLDKDYKVEAGTYKFKVGNKEVQFKFNGGSIKEFAADITSKSKDLLKAYTVNDTKNSQVLIIEGLKTGSKNKIEFLDKSAQFALNTGIIETTVQTARDIKLDPASVLRWENPVDNALYTINEGRLALKPGAELKIPVSPALPLNRKMVLHMEVNVEEIPETANEQTKPPTGPKLPSVGEINFKGIILENEKSQVILPEIKAPPRPEKIEDMGVLFFSDGKQIIKLPELKNGKQTIEIPIGEYGEQIDALLLRNRNTNKNISIENIKIYDPTARGDYRPVNPLAEANDAVLEMDGIEVTRETNQIDDLIPGVTLNLNAESAEPVKLAIKQDVELIKDSIISFVGNYNQIITTVDALSRSDNILDSLQYLDKTEKKSLEENLGLLQGELTLNQLKNKLQNTMMNPYPTDDQYDLKLLAQLGISTNTARPGSGAAIDKVKLRGYLQIDEKKLEEGINKYKAGVKQFFGKDTDGDFIVDSGLAFTLDNAIKPYTALGGILATKMQTVDSQLTRKNSDIEKYNKHLEDYEAKLKEQYAVMEGMLDTLQKSSETIDNFNKQNR